MDIETEAKRVRDHYISTVQKGRVDQTRTTCMSMIRYLLMGDQEPDRLILAADRYAMELKKDAIPLSAKRFYTAEWQEFLSPDWEPPKQEEPQGPPKWTGPREDGEERGGLAWFVKETGEDPSALRALKEHVNAREYDVIEKKDGRSRGAGGDARQRSAKRPR